MALHLRAEGIRYEREYRFVPSRRFRLDFYLPDYTIGIEVDGSTWTNGRHTRGAGYEQDCYKLNMATICGINIFRYTTAMVLRGDAINDVLAVTGVRRPKGESDE